jgi:hypothetical protein
MSQVVRICDYLASPLSTAETRAVMDIPRPKGRSPNGKIWNKALGEWELAEPSATKTDLRATSVSTLKGKLQTL